MMLEATTCEVPEPKGSVSSRLDALLREAQLDVWAAAVNHGGAYAQVALGHLRGAEPQIDWSLSAAVAVVRDRLDSDDSLPTCEQLMEELSK